MDAWQRPVHRSVIDVLAVAGVGVAVPERVGCCGALALHAGLDDRAGRQAEEVVASMPGSQPILVDSAGCGAMLKELDAHLGTEEARRFAARVQDVHEYLATVVDRLPEGKRSPSVVAISDPCHLRHVQRVHEATRAVLRPFVDLVELDDEGLCCGAGGAFSALEPELAVAIRARKLAAVERSGADVVAVANPGCAFHLAAAGIDVVHPVELVARALAPPA
jgi:glycolate oxidase iron-sulfur subunit